MVIGRSWGISSTVRSVTPGLRTLAAGMNISIVMKNFNMKNFFQRAWCITPILFFTFVMCLSMNAQDKKVEIDIGVNKEPVWYQQPWAWVLGAAIFILLLVALLRGSKKQ